MIFIKDIISVITYFAHMCVHTAQLPDPEPLQELKIPIISQDVCKASYPDLTSDMLCAGDMAGGKDACKVSVGAS